MISWMDWVVVVLVLGLVLLLVILVLLYVVYLLEVKSSLDVLKLVVENLEKMGLMLKNEKIMLVMLIVMVRGVGGYIGSSVVGGVEEEKVGEGWW